MAMVKAEVKNLRRVKTGVWVGGKRYIFPAGIQVRMNLTDEMLRELQRNNAFSVKVISILSDNGNAVRKPVENDTIPNETPIATVAELVSSEEPQGVEETTDTVEQVSSDVDANIVEVNEAPEEASEAPKKEIFTMKKDELAAYLASKGIDPEGMSRKEMLKAAKNL
jgi:hypothetical protein